MEIKGKVHCFFEQSGTFKHEFIKLGIPAEDYDIQNNFGETDHIIDLFGEIDEAYDGNQSIIDTITDNDLIIAFYPCIYFCQMTDKFGAVTIRLIPRPIYKYKPVALSCCWSPRGRTGFGLSWRC